MGHHSGFIALRVGVAGGAEEIIVPDKNLEIRVLCEHILGSLQKGKTSNIIVVAEGENPGHTFEIANQVKERVGLDFRVCILGHIQRGGSPTAQDRVLATKLGYHAVLALLAGKKGVMVGEINNQISYIPLEETWTKKKAIDTELLDIAKIMAL